MTTKDELLSNYASKTVEQVYEFTMIPNLDDGALEPDWESHSVRFGPQYRLEDADFGVRVTIAKPVPKAAVISALKSIVDTLEATDALGEQCPLQLQSLVKWFNV